MGTASDLLLTTLGQEDDAEDAGHVDAVDRVTCRTHRRWLHDCVSSPLHANAATGYRWCRRCDRPALVAVDQLGGDLKISCDVCGHTPASRANRDLVENCRRSMALARPTAA